MKLCPRSARALGQPCDEQHARDWCIKMFNHETCKDCSEGCRENQQANMLQVDKNVQHKVVQMKLF